MNLYFILSLMLPFFIGFLFISIFWPWQGQDRYHLLLKASLSVGIGFGISSCIYFLCLLLLGSLNIIILIEVAVLISLVVFCRYRTRYACGVVPEFDSLRSSKSVYQRGLPTAFYLSFIFSIILLSVTIMCYQHGMPDAWGIWNLRARFIFRGGEYWTNAFSPSLQWAHHADYPLLIPLIVARSWKFLGHETQIVPAFVSMSFTIMIMLLIVSSISTLRGRSQAYLSGLVITSYGLFILNGSFQCADVPVGFFYLSAVILLFLQERLPKSYNLSLLAGIMAGFSGWTKNEGLLFLVSIAIARCVIIVRSADIKTRLLQFLYFVIGVIPVLTIIIYFKIKLAPPNDLVQGINVADRLMDFTIHVQIIKAVFKHLLSYSPIAILGIYLTCLGIKVEEIDRHGITTSLIALTITFFGFYFTYLTTPHDLSWHLKTSLDRVLLQLWPTFIFTYFLMVRSPEQFMAFKKCEP